MKTIKPTKAWILICSIIAVSNATEHGPPQYDGSHLGDNTQWKKYQNTIVPVGVQTPDHVLSAPDLSCISADNNIFDIMNQAQEICNGTDMRCTFYHFLNHSYDKIGVLDIDKERFDDLLMKFDNWLLTDEDIEKNGGKIKEEHVFEATSVGVYENSSIPSDFKSQDASQGLDVDILNHSTNESDGDRVNPHHGKAPHEIRHKNHHSKDHNSDIVSKIKKHWKDTNHIVIEPEYNSDHKYFEVYIPKDKITGKPRTIYVEVDRDKNEFVLLDEEIDKKLKGVKPIRIELDELSEIADTAFNEVSKSSKFKEHLHNHLDDDEEAMISDISTGDHEHEIHLDDDVDEEHIENNTNPYVHHPNIFAIDAKQLLIPDDKIGKDKKVLNVIKNQIVPNKYINQAQFQVETHLDNATDHHTINDNFELLESSNDTENNQSSFHEEHFPRDTIEYDENNIDLNLKRRLNTNTENSSIDYSDISYENDNKTEYHDLSTDHENVTINDDDFIELEEHNDIFHDIDYDDNHDISASQTFDLNDPTAQIENPAPESTPKPFTINTKTELTPQVATEVSDDSESQFHAIPSDNRRQIDIHNLFVEPPSYISPELSSPYDTVPISRKDSTRILKSDSHLPSYADIDLPTGDSQITTRKSDVEHPTICSYDSQIDSVLTPSAAPKSSQYLPSILPAPPVECVVKLNTDSKSSPFNFGFSWLPSYSRIEELRLPSASNPLTLDRVLPNSVSSLPIDRGSPENSVSLVSVPCMEYSGNSQSLLDRTTPIIDSSIIHYVPSNPLSSDRGSPSNSVPLLPVPSMEFSGNSQLSLDRTTPIIDSSIIQKAPSVNIDIQEPSLTTTPCESESATPMSPKYILLSKLGLPKSNTDFDRMSSSAPISVVPCSLKDPVSSHYPNEQIPSFVQQNTPCPIDLGFNKIPFDKNLKDTMIPCPPCTNRYPYSISPYFSNPYSRPPQFIPSFMEPLPINPFQTSKSIVNTSSMSLDDSLPCISEDYTQEIRPIPFLPLAPNTQFSPLNPQPLRPNFPPNAVPCPNIWNNIPYLPYIDQHIRNYPPFVSNYLTPITDQTNKPIHLKEVPISKLEQPCLPNNLAISPYIPVQKSLIQKDLNPSLALEQDLENLSLKYGISLTNILHSLEKEISDSSTCLSNLNVPHSNLKLDNNLQFKSTNANIDDLDRSGYEGLHFKPDLTNMSPLDSTLKGPRLNLGNPLMLDAKQNQEHTITSDNIRPFANQNFKTKNQPTNFLDSSLIGPQLSTSSNNILYSDENRNANEMDVSESDSSNLMFLDSSLTGPDLKIGRPPVALGSILPQGDILTSHSKIPIAVSSQIRPKLNQNQYTKLLLDTSSIGSHLPSISAVKPLSTNEIQNMNEMVPLDSELTNLTPIDIPPGDFGNEFDKSGNVQHEKSTVAITPNPKLQKPTGYWPTNLVGKELLLKDSSTFKPLDYSLIGSEIETGNLPIIADYVQHKNNPVESQYNLHNSDTIHEENIIVPSLLAPTSLNKPINTDLNLNIISQSTKSNANQPVTNISKTSFKETDFKIVEPSSNIHDNNILSSLSKDSEMSTIDAKTHLDSSLIDQNLLPNTQTPVTSSSFDSLIHLDNSLVGPSILNKEIDSQSPSLVSGHQLESSIAAATIDRNIKPSYNKGLDSNHHLDRSLIGPSLNQGMKSQRPSITDYVPQLDRSLVPPSLYELESETSSVSNAESQLDSSLTMPSLYNTVESSTSAPSHVDSSLIGPSLKPGVDSSEVSRVFDSKNFFDSSLLGPHLSNAPFSNEKLQPQLDLANMKVLDSSLTGPHLDFAVNQFDQSDISRNHNSDSFSTSEVVPGISETTDFLNCDLIEDSRKPSIHSSDLKELLCQFKNSITKSQLSASESKPCDKLLSSIAKQSSDNVNISPTCSDLQPLNFDTPISLQDYPVSEYSPITTTYPQTEYFPLRPIGKSPCLETNNNLTPQMLAELLPYAQGVTPTLPCPPFVPMNPPIDRNWITPKYFNIQNSNQASAGLSPTELSTEDLKLSLDITSQRQIYPQLSMPNMYSEDAITPSSEWIRPSNILPIDKYMSSLPKSVLIPPIIGSTICNPDNSPKPVDVMSLLDENSYKLLQDMSILPLSQSSLTPNTISNAMVPSSIHMNPQTGLSYPQNIPYMIPTNNPPYNLQPYSQIPSESKFSEIVGHIPKIEPLPSESLKPYLQSQLHEIPHTPQFTESIPNPREFLQQPLSEPYLDSPISSLDTVLQLPTSSNGSNQIRWQSSPVYSTSISPIPSTLLPNELTTPIFPSYISPSLVSYAKPVSLPSNVLPYSPSSLTPLPPCNPYSASVLPYAAGPLTPLPAIPCKANLPIHLLPYTPSSLTPLPPHICPCAASVLPYAARPLTPPTVIPCKTNLPIHVLPYTPVSLTPLPPICPYSTSVLPLAASPLKPLSVIPYTANSVLPVSSSPLRPLKTMPLSNCPYLTTAVQTRPISSAIPCKPCQMYPCSYLPALLHPLPLDNSPYSPAYTTQLLPANINPNSPVFYEPLLAPCSPMPKLISLPNVASPTYSGPLTPVTTSKMVPISAGILTPSYVSSDISTYNYSPINTLANPSSALSPAFISPVNSILPAYNRPLASKPVFNLKPEKSIQNVKLLNTLPISYANNPFLNANQILSTSPNRPIQNQQVLKLTPLYSSQIKQNKPCEYKIGSNFQIIEGTPSGAIEENMYTYTNVMGDKYYKEPNSKYPLESLSYTLAPSQIRQTLPYENLIQQDIIPCAFSTGLASETTLHPQSYQNPHLTPCTPLYRKPCLPQQQLLPSSLIGTVPQNIYNNIPVVPLSGPFKRPVSLSTSILSSPLLKPLTPFTPATNLPLLSAPCIDTSLNPYSTLQIHNKPIFSSLYNSASGLDMSTLPIDLRGIRKTISSQLTPCFSQFSTNAPSVTFASPISTPKSSIPSKHYNLDNYIELPLIKGQSSLVKPSTVLNYNEYLAPIISRNIPSQIPISCPCISPLTTAEILKKPLICPKYISSSLPAQTILQNSIPFYEAPINYQPYIPIPTALTSSANTIVKIPSATLPYTVLPSVNLVEPLKTGRNNPQWSSFSSQNSLPVSSLPVPNPSIFISPSSSRYSTITPIISKPALSNPMIPSSLLVSSNADFRTPLKISSSFNNIPRYSYPLPALTEPLQIAPYVTASKPLGPPTLSQNLLQPITQYSNGKYTAPLLSSPYLTQPLEMIDSYPIEPFSNVQYASKPCQKLSPISAQYVCPSSSPAYNSLPSQTTPISQTNNPRVPQYSTPTASVYNIPSYSSLLAKNPFLNPNLKPEVAPYPVSNNEISSVKLTSSESMLLSNLTPLDISQEPPQSYSSPITSSSPLFMSSLLKPLSNMLPQNPGLYQSQIIPINSQYISQSPTPPQLLPSTSPLLESPLLKPLLTNSQNYSPSVPLSNSQNYSPSVPMTTSQNYSPSVPMPFANSNTAFSESSPMALSSVTSNQVSSAPEPPMSISELVEAFGPINPPSTMPYSFLKSPLFKQNQSPFYLPSYSNYNFQGNSPNLPDKANNINTVIPVEVSAISSSDSSRLSLDAETVEETKPYEPMSDIKETLSKLPPNQQRQYYPGLMSKYLTMPQSTLSMPKYPTSKQKLSFPVPSVIPEDVELISSTDFNPLSSIKSDSLLSDYSAFDRNAPTTNRPSHYQEINTLPSSSYNVLSNTDFSSPIFKQLPPEPLQNIPTKISELDMPQFFPYTTLNTDSSPFSYNQLPFTKQQQNYVNQRPQQLPVYQSSKEYKEIIQSLSPFQISSSSAYIEPQLTSSLIRGPSPMPETPLYIEPMSETTVNNVQLPTFTKYSPLPKTPVETNPEIENIQTLLNNYRYFNKITPQGENSYVYEPKSTTVEVPIKLNSVNPLIKTKEAYTEYIEYSKSIDENNYLTESDNKSVDENKPYSYEAKAIYSLPETIKDFNVPDYNNYNAQRSQRLSNLNNFCANNHIGKTPQFDTVPTYNKLPIDSAMDVVNPSTTKYPDILKDLTNIPTKHFGSSYKSDTSSLRPSEYYPELAESAENAPNTKSYPQNYLSPYAETKLPTNLVTETSEIPPTSFAPYNNINDIKYSGYKTYQLPSLKSPKTLQNVGTPAQLYNPSFVQYVPPNLAVKSSVEYQQPNAPTNRRIEISEPVIQTKLSLDSLQESPKYNSIEDEIAAILAQYQAQQNTAQLQSNLGLNTLAETTELNKYNTIENEPVISRYQTPENLKSPVYSKIDFDTSEESLDFNEHVTTKDEPVGIDSINNLKTSLINYITKRDEIKNNLDSNNQELTIPLGNIAIVKKEPYDADTIKTNDPSIGLKVWKSNVKIVQAELSLKYKDLSVVNFMPIVNNIDNYDMDEIRKIVKNYIDEKYGHHIEIKEPYNVDNQYTVIKDFDHNAVSNKYNLLWPTNYV